jgi:hypothetical protein
MRRDCESCTHYKGPIRPCSFDYECLPTLWESKEEDEDKILYFYVARYLGPISHKWRCYWDATSPKTARITQRILNSGIFGHEFSTWEDNSGRRRLSLYRMDQPRAFRVLEKAGYKVKVIRNY